MASVFASVIHLNTGNLYLDKVRIASINEAWVFVLKRYFQLKRVFSSMKDTNYVHILSLVTFFGPKTFVCKYSNG